MNNKIKEKMTIGKAKKILRGFLSKDCYYDTPLYYAIPYLLDCITNLQQENETRQQDINNLTYQLAKMKEENERLKELCDKYEEEHSNEFKIWKEERHELLDYKSRCEKASEELQLGINSYNNGGSRTGLFECMRVSKNILQNGSDNK